MPALLKERREMNLKRNPLNHTESFGSKAGGVFKLKPFDFDDDNVPADTSFLLNQQTMHLNRDAA